MGETEKRPLFDRCELKIVVGPDGKPHIEADCEDKASRNELAAAFEEEAILRVKPSVAPPAEQAPLLKGKLIEPEPEATE